MIRTRDIAPAILLVAGCSTLSGGEDEPNPMTTDAGVLKVAPLELTFGAVELNSSGETESFSVANAGSEDIHIQGLEISGESVGFTLVNAPDTLTLTPGEQADIDVQFLPTLTGELSGAVRVLSDDADNPSIKIDLTGSGSEYTGGTDPLEDGDIDVFILVDTAYSYSCYHPDPEEFAKDLVEALFSTFDNVAVGIGQYDDYVGVGSGWAASNGHPYTVRHLISTDEASLVDVAQHLAMYNGGDSWGSGYEAVYQAAWGPGYDQDCDGTYESANDVPPFQASSDDLFTGTADPLYDATVQGVGDRAGVGWRDKATHIIILGADNVLRDEDKGGLPSDSCEAAGSELAVAAANAADVKILGVNVYEYQAYDSSLQAQLTGLAESTDSMIDKDGDGTADDAAVLYGSWNWPPINDVVEAVRDLSGDL